MTSATAQRVTFRIFINEFVAIVNVMFSAFSVILHEKRYNDRAMRRLGELHYLTLYRYGRDLLCLSFAVHQRNFGFVKQRACCRR